MRISHGQLETCLRDPNAWVTERRSTARRYFRTGYEQILLLGIYRLHGTRSREQGREGIEGLFRKHDDLRNETRKDGVRERYEMYADWCEESGVTVVERRVTLEGVFGTFLTLGGHLHRVDGTRDGVRGVVLGDYGDSWDSELRMPLIQLALANRYGLEAGAISIGVQRLDGGQLRETSYNRGRLRVARQQFVAISEYVKQRWGRR